MPLEKQPVSISFVKGLNQKIDGKQLPVGNFEILENSVFDKVGLMIKRNGFPSLPTLPVTTSTALATYKGGLVAAGSSLYNLSAGTQQWNSIGSFNPIDLQTVPAVRTSSSQLTTDSAVASNGLSCVTFSDSTLGASYQIIVASSGQVIVPITALPSGAKRPMVFVLGNFFVVTFTILITATPHLQYIAIPIYSPTVPGAATDLSTQVESDTAAYDGVVANNALYIAWSGSDGGGAVRYKMMTSAFTQGLTGVIATFVVNLLSVTADTSGASPVIWITHYRTSTTTGTSSAYDSNFGQTKAPFTTLTVTQGTLVQLGSIATGNVLTLYGEASNVYSFASQTYVAGAYSSSTKNTNLIVTVTATFAGSVAAGLTRRSMSLASKPFYVGGQVYILAFYGNSTYQGSLFLLNGSLTVVARLAYSNADNSLTGGVPQGLPQVTVSGTKATLSYRIKDFIAAISTGANQAPVGGIYTQLGINLVQFTIGTAEIQAPEIAESLHLSGGLLWQYDGVKTVEHGFNLYPDNLGFTTATTGGSMKNQKYFYEACYEWSDGNGMIHRSAPSLPLSVDLSGSGTSTNTATINVPTLRITEKITPNPIRIVLYRWSTDNQNYYRVTSITSPLLNTTTADSVSFVDTQADSTIVGNDLVYTTGGVVEDIASPAVSAIALFKSRMIVVDAEDRNVLWYSKQVIEGTPVEFSDLFTIYVPPTTATQVNTGPITALSAMDDNLIIFKENAIYYLTGRGPDNTGANNDFTDPVFVTSTVGCIHKNSIVTIPNGIIFQSNKGIWLLGRDMSTQYIGSGVDNYITDTVLSAIAIPGTNQVRFTMRSAATLVYDYFRNEWNTFSNITGISSVLYLGAHTYVDSLGRVFQETAGTYVDGSRPTCMKFRTSWINVAGLQGFERAYYFFLIGDYKSPHKLQIDVAYDYNGSPTQSVLISPDNYSPVYGSDPFYGSGSPYGGATALEQWRIFFTQQKCQAFQITVTEIYDSSLGVAAGQGLTLSGINMIVGMKSGYPRLSAERSTS